MADQNRIKIAVCDDRQEDRSQIITLLGRYLDEKSLVAEIKEYESGEAFLESDTTECLLVFMDIYMKEMNGIDAARELLHRNPRVQVVFGSTSREFAVEAYDMEALHYLLKPIGYENFAMVMDKFYACFSGTRSIEVKVGRLKEDIYLDDLIWIEANGKKSILHTWKADVDVSETLAELEQRLPPLEFYRPIRWAVVSIGQIQRLFSDHMIMKNGKEISISRTEREKMKQAYADYRWNVMRQRMRR